MKSDDIAGGISMSRLSWCAAALLFAVFVYFYALDSQYIPKNGDEYPYTHITRMTAESGHMLPLRSGLNRMRNTKPPLLFWQGIASTDWGSDWTLWNLRFPSVVYTLLTAMLALLLAWRLSGRVETGVVAALAFLGFFSTYRFGRPFLTDPALVFWLFLPFFIILQRRPESFNSRLAVPLAAGLSVGVSLLYKSFVLVVPVCIALAWWYLRERNYRVRQFLLGDGYKVMLTGALALGVFSLWFLLDPDPAAIWKEFVVGENMGKLDPHSSGYLKKLLWGSSSLWSLALDFLANSGLLIFPVAALFFLAFRDGKAMPGEKKLLWIWIITLFIIFAIPSQRSGRYLLPAMPAVAVLLALEWERIGRRIFIAPMVCGGALLAVVTVLSIRLYAQIGGSAAYPAHYWLLLAACAAFISVGIFIPRFTRPLAVTVPLLLYLVFASFVRPLDTRMGVFPLEVREKMRGRQVWVPCNFRAKDERIRFLLPGADIHGYQTGLNLDIRHLSGRYPLFAVQVPILEGTRRSVLARCPGCVIVGERMDMRTRHKGKELREMFLEGKLFELLFVREFLVESPLAPRDAVERWASDECR